MIDDDFQNIFRKMMEQFFGPNMEPGRNSVEYKIRPGPVQRPENVRKEIEQIELDDRLILIIENIDDQFEPIIKGTGTQVKIEVLTDDVQFYSINVPFPVNPEESYYTIRNGTIEINLIRDEGENSTDEWFITRVM